MEVFFGEFGMPSTRGAGKVRVFQQRVLVGDAESVDDGLERGAILDA